MTANDPGAMGVDEALAHLRMMRQGWRDTYHATPTAGDMAITSVLAEIQRLTAENAAALDEYLLAVSRMQSEKDRLLAMISDPDGLD